MLGVLGLGTVAEAVYQAMLNDPGAGVSDISRQLGWSEEQVRQGLGELEQLSLVRSSYEVSGQLRPVAPQLGLAALYAHQERELRARQEALATSKLALEAAIQQYSERHWNRQPAGEEQLIGLDAILERIATLAAECTSEIMGFAPNSQQSSENLDASKPADAAVLVRGIRMRTVYQNSFVNDAPSASYARWLVEQGAEVRIALLLKPRMIIYDRATAVLAMDTDNTAAGAIVVSGGGVLAALCELFERVWDGAGVLGAPRADDNDELTAQERAVLKLLAEGHTDEVVARKLGVSVRTERRITAGIMSRLRARSRFGAGVLAARRGWL